jgi:biotin carboxyl carrier protein
VIRRRLGVAPVPRATARRRGAPRASEAADGAAPAPDPTVAIVAPLSGIFYAAPSPDSPPFVTVGEPIQAGQTVCIIEAMKVFNDIKAEIAGVAAAVLPQPGQLVHQGDALIRVRPV